MKIKKRVLCPERLRRIPGQFSWLDQRLVSDRYLSHCSHGALALYLVLVTVGDVDGVSYYSDTTLQRLLRLEPAQLVSARRELSQAGLILFERPLYQVLSLELPLCGTGLAEPLARSEGQAVSTAQILQRILKGVS